MEREERKKKPQMRLSNDSLHSRPFPPFSAPSSSRRRRDLLGGEGEGRGTRKAAGDDKECCKKEKTEN